MRSKPWSMVLVALLTCSAHAAEVDCTNQDNGYNVVDLFDPNAEISKRQEALQGVVKYAHCPETARMLGLLYRHGPDLPGNLVPKDSQRAKELLLLTAEAGNHLAYADLAEMELKEKQGREAMKWAQVYLYFVKSRSAFGGESALFESSGYNGDLLYRAERAWRATKPRLRRDWIAADLSEYLKGRKASILEAVNQSDTAAHKTGPGPQQQESGGLQAKSMRSCDLRSYVTGYATYFVEVHPDGHAGRIVLENFSPQSSVGEELRKCAGVYDFYPFEGTEPRVARIPVFAGYGPQLNFKK